MGLTATYECPGCRYTTKALHVGAGEQVIFRLVSCSRCKTLRVARPDEIAAGCRRHRQPFTVHDEDGSPPCPKCGEALTSVPVGLWD